MRERERGERERESSKAWNQKVSGILQTPLRGLFSRRASHLSEFILLISPSLHPLYLSSTRANDRAKSPTSHVLHPSLFHSFFLWSTLFLKQYLNTLVLYFWLKKNIFNFVLHQNGIKLGNMVKPWLIFVRDAQVFSLKRDQTSVCAPKHSRFTTVSKEISFSDLCSKSVINGSSLFHKYNLVPWNPLKIQIIK